MYEDIEDVPLSLSTVDVKETMYSVQRSAKRRDCLISYSQAGRARKRINARGHT